MGESTVVTFNNTKAVHTATRHWLVPPDLYHTCRTKKWATCQVYSKYLFHRAQQSREFQQHLFSQNSGGLPDGIEHNKLDLSAVSQDAHHRLGDLVHGVVGSRAAVVVRRAHRQHYPAVARLEQRQRTPAKKSWSWSTGTCSLFAASCSDTLNPLDPATQIQYAAPFKGP